MKKVWIEDGCITCGECVDICPEVFTIEETCEVIPNAPVEQYQDQITEAAEACPVEVIKFE